MVFGPETRANGVVISWDETHNGVNVKVSASDATVTALFTTTVGGSAATTSVQAVGSSPCPT